MAIPFVQSLRREPRAMVAAPGTVGPRNDTELALDRVLEQRYRIVQPIGAGGSSQVYLAHDTVLGREVAIKVLDRRAADDAMLRRLFVKEARALAQLSHPNVVAVHDVGEVDGLPFIVMEHVPGASLKQRVERGALPVAEALRLAVDIARGLDFTHSRGIIHADLKPSNILLDEDERAKICDFGIARTPQEDAETPQLFATALYVSPERVEGRPASTASDVYGLGLVLYEMLVGKPPFTSSNPAVLLRDHVVRQPVPPSHLRPSLPKELDAIVLQALAKDPEARYMRAGEMAAALEKVLEAAAAPTSLLPRREHSESATTAIMTEPIRDFVPATSHSPVVALIQAHGQPIRRAFYAALAGLPVFGLFALADFGLVPAVVAALFVAAVAVVGQLGIALAIAWVIEVAVLFLFVPGLAFLFALAGLWLWLRDVSPEHATLAVAMPVTAPLGFAPALVLTAATVHGLGGIAAVASGAAMTVVYAIASGKQSLGPYVQTGLELQQESLFSPARASEVKDALSRVVQPGSGERFAALAEALDPTELFAQVAGLLSLVSAADVGAFATVLGWVMAALVVWTITRLLRALLDTVLSRARWFALYVFAATLGVTSGAAVLYMLFVTWPPLARAAGRPADGILFLSALTGALVAIAIGVVISATERSDDEPEERTPAMTGRRSPVR